MKRLALLLGLLALPAAAEPPDAALVGALGVELQKPAGDGVTFSHGSGVYLGDGLVLTAAHVVSINPSERKVSVSLDGWLTDATIEAIGEPSLDLALLKIAPAELSHQRSALKPVDVCTVGTAPNQPVLVAATGKVTIANTIGTPIHSSTFNSDWSTLLSARFEQGNSGGGVFDAAKGCLAGIIIIGATDPGAKVTEFVPAAKISMFLAVHRPTTPR